MKKKKKKKTYNTQDLPIATEPTCYPSPYLAVSWMGSRVEILQWVGYTLPMGCMMVMGLGLGFDISKRVPTQGTYLVISQDGHIRVVIQVSYLPTLGRVHVYLYSLEMDVYHPDF